MRGVGFVVAIAAGVAAGVLHMFAMSAMNAKAKIPVTAYAAVQHDYEIGQVLGEPNGDKKKKPSELFFKIDVPDNAKLPGVKLTEVGAAIGQRLVRPLKKGELVLLQDIGPSSPNLMLGEGEHVMFVSIEGIAFEPNLVKVGTQLGFVVEVGASESAVESGDEGGGTSVESSSLREVGPFRVVSIGDAVAAEAGDNSKVVGIAFESDPEGKIADNQAALLAAQQDRTLRAVTIFPDTAVTAGMIGE